MFGVIALQNPFLEITLRTIAIAAVRPAADHVRAIEQLVEPRASRTDTISGLFTHARTLCPVRCCDELGLLHLLC